MAKTLVQIKDPKQADLIEEIETKGPEQNENVNPDADILQLPEPQEEQEDASVVLKQQIDALKKSEEIQKNRAERYRQEAEDARRVADEKTTEAGKVRKDAVQSQYDAVTTALAAAQSESESAKRDIKTALTNGDVDAQADAYERLATARANISKLEDGKFELEARIKNPPQEEPKPQQNALPQRIQRWLQKNPDFITDPRKNDRLRSLHWDVIDEGHEFDSDGYIESMETKLGLRQQEQDNEEEVPVRQTPKAPVRTPMVSAPVSREAPSTPNRPRGGITKLTPAQVEAAKIAGVTEKVYVENLNKINEMKANGTYGDRQ